MGLHTETEGIIGEEERKFLSDRKEAEVQPVRHAAADLAATVTWLPDRDSSPVFAERCESLADAAKLLSERTRALPAKNTDPEPLLVLRSHTSFIESWVRNVSSELARAALPVVSHRSQIVPRVLAIALAFIDETGANFGKSEFTAFCLAFESAVPLQFHEIGSLVSALKLVLLERMVQSGLALVSNRASKRREPGKGKLSSPAKTTPDGAAEAEPFPKSAGTSSQPSDLVAYIRGLAKK